MAPSTQSTGSCLLPPPEMASCDAHLCSVQIFLTESIQQFLGRHYSLFFNTDFPWLFRDYRSRKSITYQHWTGDCRRQIIICRGCLLKVVASCPQLLAIQCILNHYSMVNNLYNSYKKFHDFTIIFDDFSTTYVIFSDFAGLGNGLTKFPDSPWPGDTLSSWPTIWFPFKHLLCNLVIRHTNVFSPFQTIHCIITNNIHISTTQTPSASNINTDKVVAVHSTW